MLSCCYITNIDFEKCRMVLFCYIICSYKLSSFQIQEIQYNMWQVYGIINLIWMLIFVGFDKKNHAMLL
jgi:hypothetical protein